MTGAGSFPAGVGLAGADPVADPSLRSTSTPPAATLFDLTSRSFPVDEQGRLRAIHPVDQGVALALGVGQGGIANVPELGHRLRRIRSGARPSLQREVEDFVRLALRVWLERSDIALLAVVARTHTAVRGRVEIFVTYRNLRLRPSSPRTLSLPV